MTALLAQNRFSLQQQLTSQLLKNQTRSGFQRSHSNIKAAFRDPSSPFHLRPGTKGPAHPEDHNVSEIDSSVAEAGRVELLRLGFDPTSFWEQPIVWGDHDSFQCVPSTPEHISSPTGYNTFLSGAFTVRFFESGRIKWMTSLGDEIGGPEKVEAMIRGKGVSLILKSISLNYKRPVTYPDTLLIAHKPHAGVLQSASHTQSGPASTQVPPSALAPYKLAKTHFHCLAVAWSHKQQRIVTESDSVLVWYDYDKLTKCSPGEKALQALERRIVLGMEASRNSQP
ncbi:hypothetical protein BC835DRAFT_1424747 [Cytidiella melzeri]|nr:hypothetical protein BC835DRAFT_1424747 [Cytidiella melzeri]